ncbi:hypothetical protein FHQ18_11330 [Deferribacter autotrophicus]|uniref:Uncharacterized protein n=1 Tax=Deferribacter autotrophicus TaxID=500465 RepID=A0A5A8F0H4_9BACT|nr:hypothetical protein [Deferribacter autotrophicus]KAA0257153.1 hypothetical protein FHQ18_11330 [Deferribacter autotrophicus]
MIYLIALIIFSIPIILVIKPIITNEELIFINIDKEEDSMSLDEKKKSVFTTLAEIEFDYKMNKLSPKDYKKLSDYYRKKAALILKEEELMQENNNQTFSSIDDEIEKEISKYKKQKMGSHK